MKTRSANTPRLARAMLCLTISSGGMLSGALAAGPGPFLAASPLTLHGRQQAKNNSLVSPSPTAVATIRYEKTFKGSIPEYVAITVGQDGGGTWDIRRLDEQAAPQAFTVPAPLATEIFRLAGELHDFAGANLDVQRRIAYLGKKTFRYQQGAETNEASYNYTLNENAAELQRIFEGLGREEADIQDLKRVMRYDHLGVNEVLQRIDVDANSNSIPAPENLTPVLDQISSDERYMQIARQRAQALAQRLRATGNHPAQATGHP